MAVIVAGLLVEMATVTIRGSGVRGCDSAVHGNEEEPYAQEAHWISLSKGLDRQDISMAVKTV